MAKTPKNILGMDIHPTDKFLSMWSSGASDVEAATAMREAYDKLVGTDKEALESLLKVVTEIARSEGYDEGHENGGNYYDGGDY